MSPSSSSSSSCLGRAAVPVKRVWRGLTARLGFRRAAYVPMNRPDAEAEMDAPDAWLGGLRKEVRTCEYDDVHVMWEMLSSNTTTGVGTGGAFAEVAAAAAGKKATVTRRARKGRNPAAWSRLVYYCCAF